jgi:hypothetical protein
MSNFTFAIVTIVYALVCLTKESVQGRCTTSKSAGHRLKKDPEDEREMLTFIEQEKLNLSH